MAAGLEIEAGCVDPFRRAFVEHATSVLEPADLVPVERVDAVATGASLGMGLAEELEGLRPFGMGNPGVNLLVPAAGLSDVRPMGEGRHARFTVSTGGARARAVAFGVGTSVASAARMPEDGEAARHDVVARLELNRWEGSVEPRLVVRSLHDLPEGVGTAAGCGGSCAQCKCGMAGGEWLAGVWRERERLSLPQPPAADRQAIARTVVDHRAEGPLGALADLLSSDGPVLVACADVSRRRALFDVALSPMRFGRSAPGFASMHCARPEPLAPGGELAVSVTDHAWLERDPEQAMRFEHVFLLDPPASENAFALLQSSGTRGADSWLHLGWSDAEVEFALAAYEHELALRPALTAIWRALAAQPGGLGGAALEQALAGDGRHPRTTVQAARCIAVLEELDLVAAEPSTATVRCTMTSTGRTELEQSSTFADCMRRRDEGLKFLQTLTADRESRRAA
jgi:single-stranded-DNA-specific exonuclease